MSTATLEWLMLNKQVSGNSAYWEGLILRNQCYTHLDIEIPWRRFFFFGKNSWLCQNPSSQIGFSPKTEKTLSSIEPAPTEWIGDGPGNHEPTNHLVASKWGRKGTNEAADLQSLPLSARCQFCFFQSVYLTCWFFFPSVCNSCYTLTWCWVTVWTYKSRWRVLCAGQSSRIWSFHGLSFCWTTGPKIKSCLPVGGPLQWPFEDLER